MISLISAFRLCDIRDEIVYLRLDGDKDPFSSLFFWSEKIRKKLDMKKVKVVQIRPKFSYGDYEGIEFVVRGISKQEIERAYYNSLLDRR